MDDETLPVRGLVRAQPVEPLQLLELSIDLLNSGLDRCPRGVAHHAVEVVVSGDPGVVGGEAEVAVDHLPLDRCPIRHRARG